MSDTFPVYPHFDMFPDNLDMSFDEVVSKLGFGRTKERMLRVQYNTPYVRNLPIRLTVIEANGTGGAIESEESPVWGDAFVSEWRAFYDNVMEKRAPKTSPSDFRQDLELFRDMIALMRR